MIPYDPTFDALAANGVAPERITALLADVAARLPGAVFYVFQAGSGGGAVRSSGRQRTLMAFASPDAALLFAQRNNLMKADTPPRLRMLPLPRLLLAMALAPNITALLLIPDTSDPQPGQLPTGVLVDRAALVAG